jgi:glycosyltransferase involved in cell wall biosynthesis
MISQQEIAIDARWLVGGIGSYTRSLIEGLAAFERKPLIRVITSREHSSRLASLVANVAIDSAPIYGLREQVTIPVAVRGCGILHVPHFNVPLLFPGKLIVTIHDLILTTELPYRRSLASRLYAGPMLRLAVRKAAHIITVSETSKRMIVEQLRVRPSKITVIHNSARPVFAPREPFEARRCLAALTGIAGNCLLYVGNFKPHKNLSTLLRAIALLRLGRRWVDHRLLLVGGTDREYGPVLREIGALGLTQVVKRVSSVADDDLARLYSAADALIMPSRCEGFGLPVLEAMASGTPVICARASALAEVASDAAHFFEASSAEALAAAIDALLSSPPLQRTLVARGLQRSSGFSQEAFVRRHVEVYERLLNAAEAPEHLAPENNHELAGNQPT